MAKSRMSSSFRNAGHPRGFMTTLSSAFLEWLLMFLLFANGVFSYLITKFARYCNLPLPCILCSRLDNVLGKDKMDCFQDLFCKNHKSEMSSLVLCHAHCKLVDVHKMCETCLFSFATINKSNSETYRLLVGKLGDDPDCEIEQGPIIEGKKRVNNMRHCGCCNELWCPKSYRRDLLRTCSIDHEASHMDRELPLDIERDSFPQKQRSRKDVEVHDESHMYHVGYTELKVTSDTESEVMISEYESNIALYEINDNKIADSVPRIITLVDDFASEKLIHPSSDHELQPDTIITSSSTASDSNIPMHGLEELNWHHAESKDHFSLQTELMSFNDLPSHYVHESVVDDVKESDDCVEGSEVKRASNLSDEDNLTDSDVKQTFSTLDDDNVESSEAKQTPVASVDDNAESSEAKRTPVASVDDNAESSEVKQTSLTNAEECPKETSEVVSDSQPELKNDTDLQSSKSLDFGDAYNIAISNKGRQISSGSFGERTVNNSAKISEDLKQLLSQISRGTDVPLFDMSPRVSRNLEELKHLDSSSTGMQMLQKRISLERNESGLSLDGSVSEVEGESLVDRLKRQIEYDKKLLLTLYKELEEERNASAISANEAMAMITRLQEEKAALHMDASQYLRMMEEQAEYDMEALQNTNDLLAEREIEMQALEAELEHYRRKYPDEAALLAKSSFLYSSTEKVSNVENSESRSFEDRSYSRSFSTPKNVEGLRTSFRDQMKNAFLEHENEMSFVSDLSSKLKELSENEADSADAHDHQSVHREDTELPVEEISHGEELETNSVSNQKEGSSSNEITHSEENTESDVVSSEKQVSGLDVNHDATVAEKGSPNSPANQHKGWHMVQEIDLEEDKGKGVDC